MKISSTLFSLAVLMLLVSCKDAPIFLTSQHPERQNTPFSAVVKAGDLLFLSGQIGRNHDTKVLPEGIEAQTRQTIENIKAELEHVGSSLDKVIKCTVILADIDDFEAFNKVYVTYFPNKPVRTTFAASGLAAGALIEIEVVAIP